MEVTRLEDADLTDTKITPEQLATDDGRWRRRS